MNKVTFYFILTITTLFLSSCSNNNDTEIEPDRVFSEQYTTDITLIEEYLSKNYITVINNPGSTDDQDVTITEIPSGGTQPSIMSYLDATTYPKLLFRTVTLHDVDYRLYYLILREGSGESPCNVDGVWAGYKGTYLTSATDATTSITTLTSTLFEETIYPQSYISLFNTITGWSEVFPKFKSGTYSPNSDGTTSFYDFGAGVMFIPSGLAYYSSGSGSIPSYAPLVFSFKLYDVQRIDHDNDGIPSYLEDLNGDGYMRSFTNTTSYPTTLSDEILYADDTDKDGIPNFLDTDDDGDNYTTKLETKRPDVIINSITTANGYYPFNGEAIDNPLTPYIDERQGIPSYNSTTKTLDYSTSGRIRVHLDATYPIK